MSGWKTLSKEIVYQTRWMKVRKNEAINHKGQHVTYSFAEIPYPAVIVVAMNEMNEIYLQKQYRYTIDRLLWEVPAGGSEGEDFEFAAKRELIEEAGLASDDWVYLGKFFPSDGISNSECHAYLAKNVFKDGTADDEEDIREARFFSIEEVTEMIRKNELIDCESIASITMAVLHINSGKESAWQ